MKGDLDFSGDLCGERDVERFAGLLRWCLEGDNCRPRFAGDCKVELRVGESVVASGELLSARPADVLGCRFGKLSMVSRAWKYSYC